VTKNCPQFLPLTLSIRLYGHPCLSARLCPPYFPKALPFGRHDHAALAHDGFAIHRALYRISVFSRTKNQRSKFIINELKE